MENTNTYDAYDEIRSALLKLAAAYSTNAPAAPYVRKILSSKGYQRVKDIPIDAIPEFLTYLKTLE